MTKGQKQVPRLPCCRALVRAVQRQPVMLARTESRGSTHPPFAASPGASACTQQPPSHRRARTGPTATYTGMGRNSEAEKPSSWFQCLGCLERPVVGTCARSPGSTPAPCVPAPPCSWRGPCAVCPRKRGGCSVCAKERQRYIPVLGATAKNSDICYLESGGRREGSGSLAGGRWRAELASAASDGTGGSGSLPALAAEKRSLFPCSTSMI